MKHYSPSGASVPQDHLMPVNASPATISPALNDSLPITLLSQTDVLPYMS